MLLKSIEVENIRSYEKIVLDFTEGINFLSGDIGSGKSSILYAIEFVLFGFKKGDLEGVHLLRKGCNFASVKLVIDSYEGNYIEIFRRIKKSKNGHISQDNGYIKINDNLIELSPTELNVKIFEIFNFPMNFISKDKNLIYRFTIYTPQEQLKEVLFADSEKRLEIIRKIFAIDKYKQLKSAIQIYISKLRVDKQLLESKFENKNDLIERKLDFTKKNEVLKKEINLLENDLSKIVDDKKLINLKLEKLDVNVEKLRNNQLKLEKALTSIDEIKNNINKFKLDLKNKIELKNKFDFNKFNGSKLNLEKNIKDLENKILVLKNEILNKKKEILEEDNIKLSLKEIEFKLNKYNELGLKIKIKRENIDLISKKNKIFDLNNKIKNFNNELEKFDIKNLRIKLEEIKDLLLKNNMKIENYNSQIIDKKKLIDSLKKIDKCPTCLQKVNDEHILNIVNEYSREELSLKKKIKNLNLENVEYNKSMKSIEEKIELYDSKLIEFNDLKSILNGLKDDYLKEVKLNIEVKELEKEYNLFDKKKLDKEQEELNSKLSFFKDLNILINNLVDEESKLNKELNNLNIKLVNLNNEFENFKKLEDEIEKLNIEILGGEKKIKNEEVYKIKLKETKNKLIIVNENIKKFKSNLDKILDGERNILRKKTQYETEINLNKVQLLNIDKELKVINKYEKKFEKIVYLIKFLSEKLIEIASQIEKSIFLKYYIEFNEEFETIFKQLIEDNEIEVSLSDDFSIIVEQNGYDIDIKNLSGGEKSSLALAYRLALKKIIENNISFESKLSLLILDEPTDGFSENQVNRLGNILKQSGLKQIILVSHDDKIQSIANNIFFIEKVNHKSCLI